MQDGVVRTAFAVVALLTVALGLAFANEVDTPKPVAPQPASAIWLSEAEIRALPTQGEAFAALRRIAAESIARPDLSDQDDPTNVRVFARALLFARTHDEAARASVVDALRRVQGTERRANALAVARELLSYVIAAQLVGLDGEDRSQFERWLRQVRMRSFRGRTLRSTHEDRPNNWGTHAGATRIAVAAYLGDQAEIERAANVFAGWLGEEDGWRGFEFGEPWWQPPASPARHFGVNPAGAMRDGHSIDGVLPDDQRRGGAFRWPPPKENYVYEALQGAVVQAVLLERLGYPAFEWGDRALLRAFRWLHEQAGYPAEGDDTWLPHIINRAYGTDFPATVPTRPGKGMGFADWTHAPVAKSAVEPDP